MKNISILIMTLVLASCSNLSKNMTKSGQFIVRNGTYAEKVWNENLVFNRHSWYQEMSLQYDVMLAKLPANSSFNYWFSADELKDVQNCTDFRVVLLYTLDSKKIAHSSFFEQVELANFHKIDIQTFKKQLIMHPDSPEHSLNLYQVYGLCKKTKDLKPMILNFPSFQEVIVP
ncbi:MAG: hypothetical protein L6Q33_06290 [Bacteriovoracaceae bacterium]|nr:hypothetical protein [Bacteriovoracaceae bacterium]